LIALSNDNTRHILATSAYPLYNFRWIEVEDGIYAWVGGLLSNTLPLREVIDTSPVMISMCISGRKLSKNSRCIAKGITRSLP
jgi:hypothetical protein